MNNEALFQNAISNLSYSNNYFFLSKTRRSYNQNKSIPILMKKLIWVHWSPFVQTDHQEIKTS